MADQATKQKLANLIQAYGCVIDAAKSLKTDASLSDWADRRISHAEELQKFAKNQLRVSFGIDYDGKESATQLIKEGSQVKVLVNHMDGMKGGKAVIKSYSLPAMLSDITMRDGMVMDDHKWLINDEVKL